MYLRRSVWSNCKDLESSPRNPVEDHVHGQMFQDPCTDKPTKRCTWRGITQHKSRSVSDFLGPGSRQYPSSSSRGNQCRISRPGHLRTATTKWGQTSSRTDLISKGGFIISTVQNLKRREMSLKVSYLSVGWKPRFYLIQVPHILSYHLPLRRRLMHHLEFWTLCWLLPHR